jgi:hypothetical protein
MYVYIYVYTYVYIYIYTHEGDLGVERDAHARHHVHQVRGRNPERAHLRRGVTTLLRHNLGVVTPL